MTKGVKMSLEEKHIEKREENVEPDIVPNNILSTSIAVVIFITMLIYACILLPRE